MTALRLGLAALVGVAMLYVGGLCLRDAFRDLMARFFAEIDADENRP